MPGKSVLFKIRRQASPNDKPHWEEFELVHKPGMNVISSLMEIAANPVTRDRKPTTPITYESNCLEEVCGSCAMLINGKARMACSALMDNGGIHECGYAQNCVEACPKDIPLTRSIAEAGGAVMKQAIGDLFRK